MKMVRFRSGLNVWIVTFVFMYIMTVNVFQKKNSINFGSSFIKLIKLEREYGGNGIGLSIVSGNNESTWKGLWSSK